MTAPLILAFDAAAAQCAAAVVRGGHVLARRAEPMERGQAERLLPLIEETLAEAGTDWRGVGAIAVCVGPGNFTGLRIAVAAARGLALALGRPAIGVGRLEALAEGRPGRVLVAIDARRGAAYVQGFADGAPLGPPELVAAEAVAGRAAGALGLGAAAAPGTPEAADAPDPAALARIALARLGSQQPPPAPLYLRAADAAPASEPPPRILDDA